MPKKHPHVVIDTNVFINNPEILFDRTEEVFIPTTVLQELDKHKSDNGETGRNCRHAVRSIFENLDKITLHKSDIYEGTNDEKIIESALQVNATVLTGDILMYLLAKSRGVKAEFYEHKKQLRNDGLYKGIVDVRNEEEFLDEDFNSNEFAIANDGLYRKVDGKLKRLGKDKESFGLRHRNVEQRCLLELLLDDDVKLVTVTGAAGSGKAQPLYSKILTPTGWTEMGQLHIGDLVIGKDGNHTKVTGIFPQGKKHVYEVICSDGTKTRCCDEHLWSVQDARTRDSRTLNKQYTTMSLKDMIGKGITLKNRDNRKNFSIPLVDPVAFTTKKHFINPYVLGCLIGDGYIVNSIGFSSVDEEILNKFNKLLHADYVLKKIPNSNCDYSLIGKNRLYGRAMNPIIKVNENGGIVDRFHSIAEIKENNYCYTSLLKAVKSKKLHHRHYWRTEDRSRLSSQEYKQSLIDLGLHGKTSYYKFIPKEYLFDSVENRIELLQGLMDTDGTANNVRGGTSYSTSSYQLSEDVMELVRSLGGVCTRTSKFPSYIYKNEKRKGKENYIIWIKLPNEIQPFSLTRKLNRIIPKTKYKSDRKYISEVNYIGEEECQCIMVDSVDHLYITDDYIVTHNTQLSLSAAMQKVVSENKYKQIMLSKATIALGNHDIGFLPGSAEEKTLPWMNSYLDNLENLFGKEQDPKKLVQNLMDDGIVKIEPLAYIRGRSIKDTIMLLDEAQNLTEHEVKSIITRAGEGTKIVMIGDISQIDHPKLDENRNGLTYVINSFREEAIAGHVHLDKSERSELASIAVRVLK